MSAQFDFDKIVQGVNKAVKALGDLDTKISQLTGRPRLLNTVFGDAKEFENLIGYFSKLGEALGRLAFNPSVKGLNDLGRSFINFSQAVGSTAFAKNTFSEDLFVGISKLISQMRSAGGASGVVSGFKQTVSSVFSAVSSFAASKISSPAVSQNFQTANDFIAAFKFITNNLSNIAGNTPNLTSLNKLSSSFSQIVYAMNSLNKLSDKIPNDLGSRIIRKLGGGQLNAGLRTIRYVSEQLSDISGSIANIGDINKLSNALKNIGIGANKILDFANSLPQENRIVTSIKRFLGLGALPSALRTIGYIAKQLSSISDGIGDIKAFDQFGNSLEGIGKFLSSINRINLADLSGTKLQRLVLIGGLFGQSKFKQVTGFIKDIASSFKGFKGVNIPENFGTTLSSLLEFATNASTVDFKKANLGGFGDFVKKVADGVKNLSVINIQPEKLAAISTAILALERIQNGSGFLGGSGGGGTGAAGGIFQNAAGQFLGQLAFATLNHVKDFIVGLFTLGSRIRQALNNIGQSLETFGRSIQTAGTNLLNRFGLDKLAHSQLVQTAADFDHLANAVQVFGGLTDAERKSAEAFADEIGIKYPLSANDAIQATLDLIKAGRTLAETKFIIPSAADLSALGDIDLHTATEALITATNAFAKFDVGVEGSFAHVDVAANIFSSAADVSVATVQELIDGLQEVGPQANVAGLSLKQTVAILAEFNDAGLRGAKAGTQLAAVLAQFSKQTAKDELGFLQSKLAARGSVISLSLSDANGNLRDFNEFIKQLAAAYRQLGFSQAQVLDSISKITGGRSRAGLAVLLQNNGFSQIIDKMNEMDTASVRAAKLLDDFKGDVHQLEGSLITLGKKGFLPLINDSLRPFVKLARSLVDAILHLPDGFFEVAANVIVAAASLATFVGGALIAIGTVLRFEGVLLKVVGGLIGLVTNLPLAIAGFAGFIASLGTILVAVAALGTAIAGIGIIIAAFRDVIERNVGGAGDAFNAFVKSVQDGLTVASQFISEAGDLLSSLFGGILQAQAETFGQRVADFFNSVADAAHKFYLQVVQVGAFLEVFAEFVRAIGGNATTQQLDSLNQHLEQISSLPLIQQLLGRNANPAGLRRIFAVLGAGFTQLGKSIEGILSGGIGILFGEKGADKKVHDGVALFLKLATGAFQALTGLDLTKSLLDFKAGDIGAGITDLLNVVIDKIRAFFITHRFEIADAIGQLFSSGVQTIGSALSFILRLLGLDSGANTVRQVADSLATFIQQAFRLAIGVLSGTTPFEFDPGAFLRNLFTGDNFQKAVNGLKDGLKAVIVNAIGAIPTLLQTIGVGLGIQPLIDLGVTLQNSQAFKQIADALSNIASYPLKAIGDVFTGIRDLLNTGNGGNALAISGVVLALDGLVTGSGPLVALFGVMKGLFASALLPAFGILTLVTALKNIHELLAGNAGGFIIDTLTDLAQTLLSFLGIDLDKGTIIDRVQQALTGAGGIIQALVFNLGGQLKATLASLGQQIAQSLELIGASIQLALDQIEVRLHIGKGTSSDFSNAFFGLQDATSAFDKNPASENASSIFKALASSGFSDEEVRQFALVNSDKILSAFSVVLDRYGSDPGNIPDAIFNGISRTLSNGGLIQQAADKIDPGPIHDAFVARIEKGFREATKPIDLTVQANLTIEASSVTLSSSSATLSSIAFGLGQFVRGQLQGLVAAQQSFGFPGRANGGELKPNSQYGVHDTPHPEIAMFSDGTSILLTGKASGRMVKLIGMAGAPTLDLSGVDLNSTGGNDAASLDQQRKDYEKAQRKQQSDSNQKQIDKLMEQISKAWTDELAAQVKASTKFEEDEEKSLKQFNHDRLNILTDAHDNLLDAIRHGDGAQAQSVVKNAKKQLDEQKYNFDQQEIERKKQFDDEIKNLADQRKEKIDGYNDQLDDLKSQNNSLADEQSQADQQALDDQEAINRKLAAENADHNNVIAGSNQQTFLQIAAGLFGLQAKAVDFANTMGAAAQSLIAPISFLEGLKSFFGGGSSGGIGAAVGAALGGGSGGIGAAVGAAIGGATGSITHVGGTQFPANPQRGDIFRDGYNNLWSWDGAHWVIVPHFANGGAFARNKAIRLHDSQRSELMTLNDGTSLFLSGPNSGRVRPVGSELDPATRAGRSSAAAYNDNRTIQLSVTIPSIVSNASDPRQVAREARDLIMPEIRELVDRAGQSKRSRSILDLSQ